MVKIVDAEDLSPRPDFAPNHEVDITTEGILKGFSDLNKTEEMQAFYDAAILSSKPKA